MHITRKLHTQNGHVSPATQVIKSKMIIVTAVSLWRRLSYIIKWLLRYETTSLSYYEMGKLEFPHFMIM